MCLHLDAQQHHIVVASLELLREFLQKKDCRVYDYFDDDDDDDVLFWTKIVPRRPGFKEILGDLQLLHPLHSLYAGLLSLWSTGMLASLGPYLRL